MGVVDLAPSNPGGIAWLGEVGAFVEAGRLPKAKASWRKYRVMTGGVIDMPGQRMPKYGGLAPQRVGVWDEAQDSSASLISEGRLRGGGGGRQT